MHDFALIVGHPFGIVCKLCVVSLEFLKFTRAVGDRSPFSAIWTIRALWRDIALR